MPLQNRGPAHKRDGFKVALWLQSAPAGGGVPNGDSLPLLFPLNPEQVDVYYPSRITTQQTIGGAYQDNWGPGVGKVRISGVTGWGKKNPSDTQDMDGFQFFIAMRELHRSYQERCAEHDPSTVFFSILIPPGDIQTIQQAQAAAEPQLTGIFNGSGPSAKQFGFFRISSDNFQASQSRSEPQLYRYTWEMTILQDLLETTQTQPSVPFMVDPTALQNVPDPLGSVQPPAGGGGAVSGGGTAGGAGDNGPTGGLTPGAGAPTGNPNKDGGPGNPNNGKKVPAGQAAKDGVAAMNQAHQTAQTVAIPAGKSLNADLAAYGISYDEYTHFNQAANLPFDNGGGKGIYETNSQITIPPPAWLQTYRQETGTSGPKAKPSA